MPTCHLRTGSLLLLAWSKQAKNSIITSGSCWPGTVNTKIISYEAHCLCGSLNATTAKVWKTWNLNPRSPILDWTLPYLFFLNRRLAVVRLWHVSRVRPMGFKAGIILNKINFVKEKRQIPVAVPDIPMTVIRTGFLRQVVGVKLIPEIK